MQHVLTRALRSNRSRSFRLIDAGQKRATTYKALSEANQEIKVGKVLLNNFHRRHPAKMKANTIDALAVVAKNGRPSAIYVDHDLQRQLIGR